MGLGLLTKYIANILFIYFLGIIFLEYIFQKKQKGGNTKRVVLKDVTISFLLFCAISFATFAILYPAVWVKWSRLLLGTLTSQAFEPFWPFFVGVLTAILIDLLFFKNFIFSWLLKFFRKYRQLLGRSIFLIFILICVVVFLNVYIGNPWVDFEDILSSPKSAHFSHGGFSIFISNFYPLVFGVSPFIMFFVGWISIKAVLGKLDFSEKKNKFILYLLIFVLLYHSSSVFSQVASIIRYQIILYPVFLIIGALGAADALERLKVRSYKSKVIIFCAGVVVLILSLLISAPYYMAYSSFLLPNKYYLDQKDMGYGSYEAGVYLNSLSESKNLSVWTDKKGVCDFFVGQCTSNLDFKDLKKVKFDYYVVSSGRFSRTERLVMVRVDNDSPNTIRFDKLYKVKNPQWSLQIGGRKSNFVKVIKADTINIYTID